MKYEKRTNKNGTYYYSFVFYDGAANKRTRLTRDEIKTRFGKDITTEDEAKECLKLLEAQYDSQRVRALKRLDWEAEYYNFKGIMDLYEKSQKKRAPNSWKNSVFYMKHYTLPFFLTKKKLNNIELWSDYFDEFKDWLENGAVKLKKGKAISYSSKNHAIKTLNTFMSLCHKQKLISVEPKCEAFPDHLIGKRTIDDVILAEEMDAIYNRLKQNGHEIEAIFFRYLFFSGMRFSEGLAISLADLFQGELPENQLLAKKIKIHNIKYHGYIVSDSQVENGVRYPFKGKKEISEKFARTIPIIDADLWNDLVGLAAMQYEKWQVNQTVPKRDLFLFQGIDDTTATNRLKDAFEGLKIRYRCWHCLRHSRATLLIGETGDEPLARAWLGHSSVKVFERYNHLYQSLVREAKSKDTVGTEFKLKKV